MSAPPALKPRGFLAANLGKLIAAFLAGFLLFVAGFIYVNKVRQRQALTPVHAPVQPTAEPGTPTPPAPPAGSEAAGPDSAIPAVGSAPPASDTTATLEEPGRRPKRKRRRASTGTETSTNSQNKSPLESDLHRPESNAGPTVAQPVPVPPPPPPALLTIPTGTALQVRVADALSSKRSETDQLFHGTLTAPLQVDGTTVAPAGAAVTGRVVGARRSGLLGRESVLSLELTEIYGANGTPLRVKTTQWFRTGQRRRFPAPRTSDVSLPPGSQVTFRLLQPLTTVRK
jgi:hypothetical protein